MNLSNKFSPLGQTVTLHAVAGIQYVPKMFHCLNPWQWVIIEDDRGHAVLLALCLAEDYALGFGLTRVGICAELKLSELGKTLANRNHCLQT